MEIKLREDIKPLSQFRSKPAEVLRQLRQTQRPVVITERGKPAAVVVDMDDYERQREKMELLEAVLEGEKDFREGHYQDLDQVYRHTRPWVVKK